MTGSPVLVSVGAEQCNDDWMVLFQFLLCLTGYDNFLSSHTERIPDAFLINK
jgi:hypothetical protein